MDQIQSSVVLNTSILCVLIASLLASVVESYKLYMYIEYISLCKIFILGKTQGDPDDQIPALHVCTYICLTELTVM